MESSLYFSAFVLTICAVHLVWTASAWLTIWWIKNIPLSKKQLALAANSDGPLQRQQVPQRSDWYAFFHCSDLVGKDPVKKKAATADQTKFKLDQKKRPLQRSNAYSG